jgi:Tfp pilus assembly protein PilN
MLDIDFLPAQYHQRQARKRSKPWQAIVLLSFVVLVGVAAVGQYRQHRGLRAELELMAPQYEQAVAAIARLDSLQKELKTARAEAALLIYLRHPWPRTQLLRALLESLPDQILLTELEILTESRSLETRPGHRTPPDDDAEKATAAMAPAERDMAALRQQVDGMQTVIHLAGTTDDSAALHRYLGALAHSSLFRKAQLESIESIEGAGSHAARFRATIVVRPGYGQPEGPAEPQSQNLAHHVGW